MVDIPVELFFGFIGMSVVLLVIGLIREPKIPATVVFAGMFMLTITLITDNIIMGYNSIADGISALLHYNVISRTGQDDIRTGNSAIQAEFVSSSSSQLLGDTVNCLQLHIKKSGAPDLNTIVRYGVWDNSATPVLKYTFGTMNVSSVPTTVQPVKMCNFDSTYTIVQNDRIGIAWNDGDAVNRLTLDVDTTNPFDSTVTYNTRFNGVSWVSNTGTDIQGIMSLETGFAIDNSPILFTFTELPKVVFAFFSVILMLLGALLTRMGMN